jgi:hypothetical protein
MPALAAAWDDGGWLAEYRAIIEVLAGACA